MHNTYALTFLDTYVIKKCQATSPSIGTVRVSCDVPHEILVTLTCNRYYDNCMITAKGSSPLTVKGLDPGVTYSVTIDVFDQNQIGLTDQTVTETITVNSDG